MPGTYAILGATGATGQQLFRLLAEEPRNQVNVYVRSRAKLEAMFPIIAEQSNVHVFEGGLHDLDLMRRCIASTSAVFSVVASNSNDRNLSIAQDSARVLVETLEAVRKEDKRAPLPRLLFISSYSVSTIIEGQNSAVRWLVHLALGNIYGDLIKAETFLRQHEDWLQVVFVQPGVLSSDPVQRGHALSVTSLGNGGFLSYVDLAAGMIEIAESGDKYDWQGVVVQPTTPASFDWQAPFNVTKGLGQGLWQRLF